MGGNINLTKMWMAAIVSCFVLVLVFGNYVGFCATSLPGNSSQCIIEPKYQAVFGNITTQYDNLYGTGEELGSKTTALDILNFGANAITGTVNVFITGLKSMQLFFNMIPFVGNVLTAISSVIPGLASLISLAILIIGVYVAMRYIQSASNKTDLP